jgi:hypothetical protein
VYSTETQWVAFTISRDDTAWEDIDRMLEGAERYRDEDEVVRSRQYEETANGRLPSLRKVGNQTKAWGRSSAPVVVVDSSRRRREDNRTTGLSKDELSSAPTKEP